MKSMVWSLAAVVGILLDRFLCLRKADVEINGC